MGTSGILGVLRTSGTVAIMEDCGGIIIVGDYGGIRQSAIRCWLSVFRGRSRGFNSFISLFRGPVGPVVYVV